MDVYWPLFFLIHLAKLGEGQFSYQPYYPSHEKTQEPQIYTGSEVCAEYKPSASTCAFKDQSPCSCFESSDSRALCCDYFNQASLRINRKFNTFKSMENHLLYVFVSHKAKQEM